MPNKPDTFTLAAFCKMILAWSPAQMKAQASILGVDLTDAQVAGFRLMAAKNLAKTPADLAALTAQAEGNENRENEMTVLGFGGRQFLFGACQDKPGFFRLFLMGEGGDADLLLLGDFDDLDDIGPAMQRAIASNN